MEALKNELVLVTGASGFVASHVVKQLLEVGAKVRGTVRDLNNEQKVGFLRQLPYANERLQLVKADLLEDECWKDVVSGCKYVCHVASPFPLAIPSDPDSLIKPALQGTLSVLRACAQQSSIKRVVVTSSIVAIYDATVPIPKEFEEGKTVNEQCWTDGNNTTIEPYARSKALAEKAAWDFVENLSDGNKFELVTINPGLVLGPLLSTSDSTSVGLIKRMMDRSMPAVAKISFATCDVRDVAEAHLKALVTPEAVGNRHVIVTESLWMKQIGQILQKEFKQYGYSVPTMSVPNVMVWLHSLMDRDYRAIVPRLSREYYYSNRRMQEVLKIKPIAVEQTLIDTAHSLIDLGLIKPRNKKAKSPTTAESPETVES